MNKKTKIIVVALASLLTIGAISGITYKLVNDNKTTENPITKNNDDYVVYIYKSEDGIDGNYSKTTDKFTVNNFSKIAITDVNDLALAKFELGTYVFNQELAKVDRNNKIINVYYYKIKVKSYTVTGLGSEDRTNIKSYIGNNGEYANLTPTTLTYDVDKKQIVTPFDKDFNFEEYTDVNGNSMIRIPTFYKKIENLDSNEQITSYTISKTKINKDYLPYPCFMKLDGTVASSLSVGKYRSCIKDSKLKSLPLLSSTEKNFGFGTVRNSISAYIEEGKPQAYSCVDIWTLQLFRDLFTIVFSSTEETFYSQFGADVQSCESQTKIIVTDFSTANGPFCIVPNQEIVNVYQNMLFNICDLENNGVDYIPGLIYQNDVFTYQLDYTKYTDYSTYEISNNVPFYEGGNIIVYHSDKNCPFLITPSNVTQSISFSKYYGAKSGHPNKGNLSRLYMDNRLYSFGISDKTTYESIALPRLVLHEV